MARRAFSLLETLITIAMVALAFGLFMVLLHDSLKVARHQAAKDEARRAAQIGLDRILTEAREACEWISVPNSPSTANLFEMYKVTAGDDVRCPLAPPAYPTPQAHLLPVLALGPWSLVSAPLGSSFQPQQDIFVEHIRYSIQNGSLVRESGSKNGALANSLVLARQLSGLSCNQEPGPLLVVVLTYPEGTIVHHLVGKVVGPGVERN